MRTILALGLFFWIGNTVMAAEKTLSIPDMPSPVSSFGAVVSDGYLYVYGGHAGETHSYSKLTTLGKFHRLNLGNTESGWEELPGGVGVQGLALVEHSGKILRIGGMEPRNNKGESSNLHSVASCQSFDPKTKTWSDLPDLPEGRSSHDAVVIGDTLIVAGGWTMKGKEAKPEWLDKALTLDLADPKAKWQTIDQPFVNRALVMAVRGNQAVIFGGLSEEGGTDRTVHFYDLKTNKWTTGPSIPEGSMNGFSPSVAWAKDELYLCPSDGKVYQLKDDKWVSFSKIQFPRKVARMVALPSGQLLILGGAASGGNRTDAELIPLTK